ncbi:MAG: endolytic transglycosylase MltG [Candidatus Taylorbacteria bacterium]
MSARKIIIGILGALCIVAVAAIFAATPPSGFPVHTVVSIKEGSSLSEVAKQLVDQKIVRSQFLYKTFVVIVGERTRVKSGDYLFEQPESIIRVAYRTAYGVQGLTKIKVTIPEGLSSKSIAAVLKKSIPLFDDVTFIALASKYEGYLFPDTYFFFENVSPDEVVKTMRDNFDKHIVPISKNVSAFGQTISDVITMSSIVEKEAISTTDRRIIAGILWKRLAEKMPLQVDPPFFYFLNKTSDQLTVADLATDSPYNLYKHTGLPPTPIDNPGIDAITATINATTTKYFFYLSDKTGAMHYAVTYDGHLANKAKYLQ